jgi:HD-like signal output (HDOD) protein
MNSRSAPPSRQAKLTTPTQPRILIEIEELMRKPNLNLRTIAKLISQDSVLSGIFLRTINSSYYGLNHKIELVEQAIPLIGLQQTLNLIRAEALKRVTGGDQLALAHNPSARTCTANRPSLHHHCRPLPARVLVA